MTPTIAAAAAGSDQHTRPWLVIEEQVRAAIETLKDRAERCTVEDRTLGPYPVIAHLGHHPDGTEFLLTAHLLNPHFYPVAVLAPLDANYTLWRHRPLRLGVTTVEITTHASLMDAAHAAANEAVQRGAWAATDPDAVEAAYATHARPVLCQTCGR